MDLADIYIQIEEDLNCVKNTISNTLAEHSSPETKEILEHIQQSQGKLIRPILIFLGTYAVEHPLSKEKHKILIKAATAIELIHIASLVHDDVIDDADTRRNTKSIKGKFGNTAAVTTGTLLYSIALQHIAETGSLELLNEISKTVQTMCEGELLQDYIKTNKDYSKKLYYKVISSKTAVLFKSAAITGSLLFSFSKKHKDALSHFATECGYAFQLSDDYLDIFGSEKQLNKQIGQDIMQGNLTLPIIETLNTLSPSEREVFFNAINKKEKQSLSSFMASVKNSKIKNKTQSIINSHIEASQKALSHLNESLFKDSLLYVSSSIKNRIE